MMSADRFVSVSASDRKAWMLLYGKPVLSQVTPLGVYKPRPGAQ